MSKPYLIHILPIDKIPEELSSVRNGLTNALSSIQYERLHYESTRTGESAFLKITLLLAERLEIDLLPLGDDSVTLVFNPDPVTGSYTAIPLSLWYKWPILKYTQRISIDNFNFQNDIPEYFFILLDILGLSLNELLQAVIEELANNPATTNSPLQDFIATVNNSNSGIQLTAPSPSTLSQEVEDLLQQFEVANIDVYMIILSLFIQGGSVVDKFENIKNVFFRWLGEIKPEDILAIITPQFSVAINDISIGIEFPLFLFRRIDPITNEPVDQRSMLRFSIAKLEYATSKGFQLSQTQSFSFQKSEILRTGLTLEISNAQVDLGNGNNILPGTNNYPTNFKGIYVEEIAIGLPSFWKKDAAQTSAGIDIFGQNLLIGGYKEDVTEEKRIVFEGTVGLRDTTGANIQPTLTTNLPGGLTLSLTLFSITFANGGISNSIIRAELRIPKKDGTEHQVDLTGEYRDDGFSLLAEGAEGAPLFSVPLGDFGDLFVSELTIGTEQGNFFLSLKAGLNYTTNFPVVDKFLPNPLLLEQFKVSKHGIEEFSLNLKWDEVADNFVQSLSGEQELLIPLGWDLLDILFINALKLKTSLSLGTGGGTSRFAAKALIDGALKLGPLFVSVGDVGAELSVEYVADPASPSAPSNAVYIGPLAVSAAFVPPSKIGLLIDADQVKGGGAVWLDYDNQRYSGALQLNIADTLNLSAIGIIAFKAPDGAKQFSFLAVITVEFPPTHLSYGFWLTGAGGILGLNRGMDPEVLRQGVKTGLYDDILFPTDPVENFERIVTGLDAAFPITQGQFIIGPMLQIGWGGQTEKAQLFQLEIGLVIELPKPVRIALPGVLKTLLPKADSDIVSIKAAFIAILDFGAKLFSLDASLFDSHILKKFTLSGDIAMRLSWGNQPVFVLSVGGFHPEYTQVPTGLTNMSRLTISILDEPRATVKLEAYLAVTSNSVQVGARVDARFSAGDKGDFQILAYLYFDALFQFNPFLMSVEIGAGVSLEFKGTPILAIQLLFRLEGPTPWSVRGHASFAVLGIEFKVRFDKTFGEERITTSEDIDLMPLMKEALEEPGAWRALAPANSSTHELVAIKVVEGQKEALLLQTYGRLAVQQSIAPLQTALDKYGERDLETETQYYTIDKLYVVQQSGNLDLDTEVVEEEFARAQYEELEEKEKLAVPAFEKFPAGVQLSKEAVPVQMSSTVELTPNYEQILLEEEQDVNGATVLNTYNQGMTTPSEEEFKALLDNHAAATSTLSTTNTPQQQAPVKVEQEQFYVVSKVTLQPYEPAHLTAPEGYPRTRAEQWLRELQETDPATALLLQVVPASEMVIITSTGAIAIDPAVMANQQQLQSL